MVRKKVGKKYGAYTKTLFLIMKGMTILNIFYQWKKKKFYCLGVFDSTGMLIGILFYLVIQNYYIENFVICFYLRSKNFGKRILEEFIKYNKVIALMDSINDDISEKRWNFYKKLGFKLNKYKFVHPALSPLLKDYRLEILSYPEYLEKESIKEFENFIIYRVNMCK